MRCMVFHVVTWFESPANMAAATEARFELCALDIQLLKDKANLSFNWNANS